VVLRDAPALQLEAHVQTLQELELFVLWQTVVRRDSEFEINLGGKMT
tara:strand:- start:1256 stop:1396 length:141 start_codon:yes stop_codon:yes gene_type:complete